MPDTALRQTATPEIISLHDEFDRQLATLLAKRYPALAGLGERAFLRRVEPLRTLLPSPSSCSVPFVIVVTGRLVPTYSMVPPLTLGRKAGFTTMDADDLERFVPIEQVQVPPGEAYLLSDVTTGVDVRNVPPSQALPRILGAGRSPLTVEEGLAVVTHHPDLLRTSCCFSLLGSRCGDKRVTALWVSKGHPRLGWCFAGAPHTWLGSGSCAARIG